MEYFAVTGGRPLAGEVRVHGAKNSALPILAATLLVRGESVVHNCPALTDIQTALDILSCLGCQVRRTGETVTVDAAHLTGAAIPDELMGRMRASVLFLGALLARQGEASACWPGGCALGRRPIDLHIRAFQALGAQVETQGEHLRLTAARLAGRRLSLPFPSVGATENAMLAACGAAGLTRICNAAREPEIVAFSELGSYIDMPIRTYSSGMKSKLGFSINANIRPDIIIVDEALSVGDKDFRAKCRKRIAEILESGVTFLFVTHSTAEAKRFCKRGLVIREGQLIFEGDSFRSQKGQLP